MPDMDYSKLRGRIKEYGYTLFELAEEIDMSGGHFCEKMKCRYPFTQSEIEKICETLEIKPCEIGTYFFTKEVEKNSTKGA